MVSAVTTSKKISGNKVVTSGNKEEITMDIQKKLMVEFENYPEPNGCKQCKWCGELLIGTDSDYCSEDCKELYLMATEEKPKETETETDKVCIECGKPLRGNQYLYCSKACCNKHYKRITKRPKGNCAICGKPLTGTSRKYCSEECVRIGRAQLEREYQKKYRKRPKKTERLCVVCGNRIETKATKYCSKECRLKAEYQRKVKTDKFGYCAQCGKPIKFGNFCANDKCHADWLTNKAVEEGRLSRCWLCANFNKDCSWSRDFIPVTGWEAEEHKKDGITTYKVINCPEFRRG